MIDTLMNIVNTIGTVANTASSVLEAVDKAKRLLSGNPEALSSPGMAPEMNMQPFQAQFSDPYQGGAQWLPALQSVAAQNGNGWVPPSTQGLHGRRDDLTGVWCPPGNPYDQSYIRQYGPYLNLVAGAYGTPTFYAEGMLNPQLGQIHLVGRNTMGMMAESRLQVYPNWMLAGWLVTYGPYGPMQVPIQLHRVA